MECSDVRASTGRPDDAVMIMIQLGDDCAAFACTTISPRVQIKCVQVVRVLWESTAGKPGIHTVFGPTPRATSHVEVDVVIAFAERNGWSGTVEDGRPESSLGIPESHRQIVLKGDLCADAAS